VRCYRFQDVSWVNEHACFVVWAHCSSTRVFCYHLGVVNDQPAGCAKAELPLATQVFEAQHNARWDTVQNGLGQGEVQELRVRESPG
jgi:hypothetical protein